MQLTGPAVNVDLPRRRRHLAPQTLHHKIITRAREAGLAGATVLRRLRRLRHLVHGPHHPAAQHGRKPAIVVLIIDTEECIRGFLPELDELIGTGTVLLDEVKVRHYQGKRFHDPRSRFVDPIIGAPARYLTHRAVQNRHDSVFPWGTFSVNLAGCLVLDGLAGGGLAVPAPLLALLGIGFCGALTTYSTFSYETLRLVEQKAYFYATMNVLVSIVAGLGAALLGYAAIHALAG